MSKVSLMILFVISLIVCSSEKPHETKVVRPVKTIIIDSSSVTTVYSYAGIVTARYEIPSAF